MENFSNEDSKKETQGSKNTKENEKRELDKDYVSEIQKIMDRAVEHWKYLAQFAHSHQFTVIKHYLWLDITILGAYITLYFKLKEFVTACEEYGFVLSFLIMSIIFSIVALFCGVVNLSSKWYGNIVSGPFHKDTCENMVRRIVYYKFGNEYIEDLICWAGWYDEAIKSVSKVINKRLYMLRAQCYLTLLSLVFGIITAVLFVIYQK